MSWIEELVGPSFMAKQINNVRFKQYMKTKLYLEIIFDIFKQYVFILKQTSLLNYYLLFSSNPDVTLSSLTSSDGV